jgi:hypothetical protein
VGNNRERQTISTVLTEGSAAIAFQAVIVLPKPTSSASRNPTRPMRTARRIAATPSAW